MLSRALADISPKSPFCVKSWGCFPEKARRRKQPGGIAGQWFLDVFGLKYVLFF